jgi:hypothetical protein
MIRRIDNKVVVGDGQVIAKRCQGISGGIKQGQVNIGGTGIIDAVFLMQPEFDLHEHAGLLLHRVTSGEHDLEAFAVHLADRRFPHKLNCHPDPVAVVFYQWYNLGVKNQ